MFFPPDSFCATRGQCLVNKTTVRLWAVILCSFGVLQCHILIKCVEFLFSTVEQTQMTPQGNLEGYGNI